MFRHIVTAAFCATLIAAPSSRSLAQTAPPAPAAKPVPADLIGDWSGPLQTTTGAKVRLIFHIRGDGPSTMDSPDQGAIGLPVAGVSEDGGKVRFVLGVAGISFEAQRGADPKVLDGQFHQGGASIPLTLERGALSSALNRPQTPVPPFPYRSEEVGYENAVQRVHLAGTLTLPPGKGPFPVVLLISGSGQHDRDETILGHKPFLVIADYLTRRGIAVLRVDDRGIGQSTGDFAASTDVDFATDVEAGVAYLKTRPDIDRRHIGLLGHSEGGFVAPMVAADDPSIAFVVLMAAPGVSGADLVYDQVRNALQQAGAPPEVVEKQLALQRQIQALGVSDADGATVRQKVSELLTSAGDTPAAAAQNSAGVASPGVRWFWRHDPAPVLRKLRCPVLAIGGSKDTQVRTAVNLPAIREALKGDPDATVTELPGLNHLFQTAGTGQFDEYAKIEETISPAALKIMGDWVTAHVGK